MINKRLLIIFVFLMVNFSLYAKKASYGQVISLVGDSWSGGQKLKLSDFISKKSVLTTGLSSYLKVYIASEKVILMLGPYSKMMLGGYVSGNRNFRSLHNLENGMCRVIASKKRGTRNPMLMINSSSAIISIRSGDAIVMSTPAFNESEVIVMYGAATFTSKINKADKLGVLVRRREWLGVGGRFGRKIRDRMKLTKKVFSHYNYFTQRTDIENSFPPKGLFGHWIPAPKEEVEGL